MPVLETASSFAGDIDNLFLLITILVAPWFIASEVLLVYFSIKYRAKGDQPAKYITGDLKKEKRWISVPHLFIILFDVVVIVGAVLVWVNVKQTLPKADLTIRVTGQQWAWTFQHPGPDGDLDTDDDITLIDELHLEKGKTYHFKLTSVDVLHSFSIPVFRLKQDAVPGREITGWFKPTKVSPEQGWDVQCAEMCGPAHGVMGAKMFIRDAAGHAAWLAQERPPETLAQR